MVKQPGCHSAVLLAVWVEWQHLGCMGKRVGALWLSKRGSLFSLAVWASSLAVWVREAAPGLFGKENGSHLAVWVSMSAFGLFGKEKGSHLAVWVSVSAFGLFGEEKGSHLAVWVSVSGSGPGCLDQKVASFHCLDPTIEAL